MTARIEIELEAYVLPKDHEVWKCFPGRTYRFLKAVRESAHVFLDIRGLETLTGPPSIWDDGEVLPIIAADRWKRAQAVHARGGQLVGSPEISTQDRKVLGFLKGLLVEAKRGDIIVLPADGYRREVLIGELIDDADTASLVDAEDGEASFKFAGRHVRWLPSKEKRKFSADVISSLHSQAAFHLIRKDVRQEIYEVAYENFVFEDTFVATFKTTKQQFTTSDNAIVSVWFNALAAAYSASQNDTNVTIAGSTFNDLGLLRSVEAERGELSIDIASPGSVLLHSLGVFALATMALYPAMEVDAATLASTPISVSLHAVGSADESCALKVSAATEQIVQTLSVRRLQDACKIRKRAEREATLHTKARLKSQPKKPN